MEHIPRLCEIIIDYQPKRKTNYQINSSVVAESYLRKAFKRKGSNLELKEFFYILLVNRNNRVIAFHKLGEGGISGCIGDIRLAFAIALKALASGMIICHNYPSKNCRPSKQDNQLTKEFKAAGKLLNIDLLDHIILTKDDYYSYADEGKI